MKSVKPKWIRCLSVVLALFTLMNLSFPAFATPEERVQETTEIPFAYAGIPSEMLDNSILRALAYTGYDVQALKNAGKLYHPSYISIALGKNWPEILSGIPYVAGSSGMATKLNANGNRVPDIDALRRNGLCCTAFIEYYFFSYLKYVEKVDVTNMWDKYLEAANSFGTGTNRYDDLWMEAAERMVESGIATGKYCTVKDSQDKTAAYNAIYETLSGRQCLPERRPMVASK